MIIKSLSVLLIAALLFKPLVGLYMVIDYEINKDYFAKYLCENKDRPELKCEGKCYLMQKLQKRYNENETHKTKQFSQVSKIEIMDIAKVMKVRFTKSVAHIVLSFSDLMIKSEFISSVFHPPISR